MRYIASLLLLFFFEISFSQTVQTFDSSGSFTVPAGVYTLKVEAWGAGGAGGILTNGAKGGGGGGAYAIRNITVIPGATYTVTVGNGGVPTSTLAPSGGNSSFGSLVIAAGGNGASTTTGGAGGQASACTPIIGAINGTIGSNSSGNNGGAGGAGAIGGNGGLGGVANNGNGGPGIQPGGGGGGMAGPGGGGISGTGGAGRVVVTYTICSAPTLTCAANVTVNAVAPACSATTSLTRPTISNVCYRNHSLDFDGTNDYVALPSGLTSTFTNFTFEAWVYWDGPSSSTWERIMDFGSSTNVNMFLTPRSDSGTPRFAITTTGGGGEQRLTSPTALTTGQWHHIAVVLADASNTGSLYINGQLMVQNTSITLTPASLGSLANNWIGRSQYADPYFNGKIDEVRIWNTTRTQAQIQANMNNEFASMPSGLIAYYKFNNGISCCSNAGLTTLANESGSNNGTLLNFGLSTSCTSNWTDGATPLGNPLTLSNSFNGSCVVTSGSFPAGVNNVTWTVTDGYGNTSTCVQTVTVNETQAPSITCPANISNTVTAGTCARTVTFTNPVGTDNCSGPVTIQTAGLASGSNFPVGVTTNTFRVTDASGNTATCSFTVTITDNELPGITCPANVSQNVNTGICGASATYSAPVGTDNCAGSSTLQTAGLASGATYPVGVTTNTFQVTDASGNTATCSFTVTVTDNQVPNITCPANVNQNVSSGTCGAVATYTAPVGTDNCPGSTTVRTAGLASGATFPVGTTTNTFRVTDASGNSATCSFTVTITDNELPGITCPANVSQNVTSGTCGRVVTFTSPVGSDNCSGPTTIQTAGFASGATFPVGTTTNTFRVTDASGNTATCSFTVTITDNELPSITCPANIGQNVTSGTCGRVVTYTSPVGSDNCSGPITIQTAGLASGATFPIGTTANTFRVTDASGNSATCSFTVIITDNELPSITCPANVSQNVTSGTCGRVVTFTSPVGSDNCSGPTTIQTAGFASGATFPVGTTTNTFRVTDASGNTATCSFTVTITDNELPSITCPANIGQNATSGTCGRVVTFTSPVGFRQLFWSDNDPNSGFCKWSYIPGWNYYQHLQSNGCKWQHSYMFIYRNHYRQ
ncbi:MAG: HYR domain-containing protein [Saprospiraceae bacterium]|nr:HYR domain-containing protein [Saprospiraceae bacterium]